MKISALQGRRPLKSKAKVINGSTKRTDVLQIVSLKYKNHKHLIAVRFLLFGVCVPAESITLFRAECLVTKLRVWFESLRLLNKKSTHIN